METYHGTSSEIASRLANGTVDVNLGGGELGQGFYTGERLYLAKAWAYHISGDVKKNVVQFTKPDSKVEALTLELLDHGSAALKRHHIRVNAETRIYQFGVDMVWAPIVGKDRISGDQCKWESKVAEHLLNGSLCMRKVI